MPFPTGPRPEPVPPDPAQVDRAFRSKMGELGIPDELIPKFAKEHAPRFGVDPQDHGALLTELPSGGRVRGPAGISRLAYELAEEHKLGKLGEKPSNLLRKRLEALGATEAVIAANEGRVRREKDGRISGQPVKSGTSVLMGHDDVITRIAAQVMEQYAEEQRRAEPIAREVEAEVRARGYGI